MLFLKKNRNVGYEVKHPLLPLALSYTKIEMGDGVIRADEDRLKFDL